MSSLRCPQCGANLPSNALTSKLVECTYCHTVLLLEPEGELVTRPSLLGIGSRFQWRNQTFRTQGYVQFGHAEGWLREWQIIRESDRKLFWLGESDENWFLLQGVTCKSTESLHWCSLQPNRQLTLLDEEWLVTEKYSLQHFGTQGEVEVPCLGGDVFQQVYLARPDASILLLIWVDDGLHCRRGYWLDPDRKSVV